MLPARTSISLPARTAWLTAGAAGCWANANEQRRMAARGKKGRIMLGLTITSSTARDKRQRRPRIGATMGARERERDGFLVEATDLLVRERGAGRGRKRRGRRGAAGGEQCARTL